MNIAYKRYISDLVSHALMNPSKKEIENLGLLREPKKLFKDIRNPIKKLPENKVEPRPSNRRMVYLTGRFCGFNKVHKDYLFGYKIKGLVLKREVEMHQWTEESPGVYVKQWEKEPVSSKNFPRDKRNPPWMFFNEEFKVLGLTKFMNFWIKTSEIVKVLDFTRCSFMADGEAKKNPRAPVLKSRNTMKFDINPQRFLMTKTKIHDRFREIFLKNLKFCKVTKDFLLLETKQNGYYRVSYSVCKSDDVITVLGINYNGKLEPISNHFVVKGHKEFNEMVSMIDTSPNKTITYTLATTLFLGIILRLSG